MVVVDASVAVKVYVAEVGSDAAAELMSGPGRLLAPELIGVEVAGALCRRARNGEIAAGEAEARSREWLADFSSGMLVLTPDRELLPEAVALSTKLKHPLADCLYLAVAVRAGAPLVTADRTFHKRAKPLYKPVTMLAGCENN